jgi:hypothetical protein
LGKSPIPERKIRKSRWDEKNPHVTTALLWVFDCFLDMDLSNPLVHYFIGYIPIFNCQIMFNPYSGCLETMFSNRNVIIIAILSSNPMRSC